QLELTKPFGSVFGEPGRGGPGIELDTGATRRADDDAGRRALEGDRVQAMRALERHGRDLVVPQDDVNLPARRVWTRVILTSSLKNSIAQGHTCRTGDQYLSSGLFLPPAWLGWPRQIRPGDPFARASLVRSARAVSVPCHPAICL